MKKMLIAIFITCILFICIFSFFFFRPIQIIEDVELRKKIDGGYDLFSQNTRLGYFSELDSWYVQKSQVYGSLSADVDKNYETEYFYVDICSREIYITPYYLEFEKFLDERNIAQDKRNYMSGNNLINMQKFPYSTTVTCE